MVKRYLQGLWLIILDCMGYSKIIDLGITLVLVNKVQSQETRQICSKKEKK
jgi:hypothetical protein